MPSPGALTTLAGSPHAQSVVRSLRSEGDLTLSELAERTGLSRPTVALATEELEGKGWVATLDPRDAPPQMGRPARRYRFMHDSAFVIGVDVGLHKVLVLAADLNGVIVREKHVDLPATMTGTQRVDVVAQGISETLAEISKTAHAAAITIGAPGVVDRQGRILRCPPIPEWDAIDLRGMLSEPFHCPVFVENDVMSAAWAEFHYGSARGTNNFVYLLAGHRISAASVISGQLHRGSSGAAGMIGELDEVQWPSAPARLIDAVAAQGIESMQQAFTAADQGEALAVAAVERYLDDLALGLTATALVIDPDLVVIGGGLSQAGGQIAERLQARVRERSHLIAPRVAVSSLGDRATARGALRVSLDHLEQHLLFPG